jgi:hypothetical protein
MHTDTSLALLETLTAEFGQLLRQFRDKTCTKFSTVELPREASARQRRENIIQDTLRELNGQSVLQSAPPAVASINPVLNSSLNKMPPKDRESDDAPASLAGIRKYICLISCVSDVL